MTMNGRNAPSPDEVSQALTDLALRRGMKFDDTDLTVWRGALQPYANSGGIITEAISRLNQDAGRYVNLVVVQEMIRLIRAERMNRALAHLPEPPSGLSDADYTRWLEVRNDLAARAVPVKEIGALARRAIGAPDEPRQIAKGRSVNTRGFLPGH